jgi:hypothetical protein
MTTSSFPLNPRRLIFCFFLQLQLSAASDATSGQPSGHNSNLDSVKMSNSIFNSIHDSMRQLGSSVNYESRCAFLATVPAGVRLYHGTSKEAPPAAGLKWLAFEPEHAMMFSHSAEHWSTAFEKEKRAEEPENRGVPDADRDQKPIRNSPGDSDVPVAAEIAVGDLLSRDDHLAVAAAPERPSSLWTKFKDNDGWGYLHTYSTTQPLRLLYVDGTSAAKTTLGTLDFQDRIILQDRLSLGTNLDDDNTRAAELCRIVREDWHQQVHGFLRMETGFEIIMCELESARLEAHGTVATQQIRDTFATYKALAQRFNGIGKGRVILDYDNFVTIHGDDLNGEVKRAERRAEVDALVMKKANDMDGDLERQTDWQAVTDMIIERFSAPLRLLSSEHEAWESKEAFDNEAQRLMLPFIDHRRRNRQDEVDRCASYFQPGSSNPSFGKKSDAMSAILEISRTICGEIIASTEDDEDVPAATRRMHDLVRMLNWSSWKQCMPGCVGREVCYVPVWPFSLALDRRRAPLCVDEGGFYGVAVQEMMASTSAARAQRQS